MVKFIEVFTKFDGFLFDMNAILLNLLKKKFILEGHTVLDYIRKESAEIVNGSELGVKTERLRTRLFFEVAVFNMHAGAYLSVVKLRDNHPVELQQFLTDFNISSVEGIKNGPSELSQQAHLLNARRFFYEKLMVRFLKPRPYVTQSLGFIMDMLIEDDTGFEQIKPILQPVDRLLSLLFVRYLDNLKKMLLMGRDNRFILTQ